MVSYFVTGRTVAKTQDNMLGANIGYITIQ